jgi:hypothetical protein
MQGKHMHMDTTTNHGEAKEYFVLRYRSKSTQGLLQSLKMANHETPECQPSPAPVLHSHY